MVQPQDLRLTSTVEHAPDSLIYYSEGISKIQYNMRFLLHLPLFYIEESKKLHTDLILGELIFCFDLIRTDEKKISVSTRS